MVAGIISDFLISKNATVYPFTIDTPREVGIPNDLKGKAMLSLRNPVRLITLNTPEFSKFFRVLYYFTYIFFIYAIAGHLATNVAFFLVVAIIGGFFGILLNVLKGLYSRNFYG